MEPARPYRFRMTIFTISLTLTFRVVTVGGRKTRRCTALYLLFDEPAGPLPAGLSCLAPGHEQSVEAMKSRLTYAVVIELLPREEGGGFLALVPDLPGCMNDGESPEEAVANVTDAIDAWIETAKDLGRAIPTPSPHLVLGPVR